MTGSSMEECVAYDGRNTQLFNMEECVAPTVVPEAGDLEDNQNQGPDYEVVMY